jgi:hypothetical protein
MGRAFIRLTRHLICARLVDISHWGVSVLYSDIDIISYSN